MKYADILRNAIDKENLSQGEISNKCKELGAPISRGQLNKIISGKVTPPQENVSRALAKICNIDERTLVLSGYLEKAPKELRDFFNKLQDFCMNTSLLISETDYNNDLIEDLKNCYREETREQFILTILDMNFNINVLKDIASNNTLANFQNINNIEDLTFITMEDDSMERKIPKGSKLRLIIPKKYNNGDIVLVETKNTRFIRVLFNIGKDIALFPFNSNYTSLLLKNGDYKIIAKIKSIEIAL